MAQAPPLTHSVTTYTRQLWGRRLRMAIRKCYLARTDRSNGMWSRPKMD